MSSGTCSCSSSGSGHGDFGAEVSLTSIIFLLAFAAAMVASLVRHPAYGLYTYVAIFYLHPPDRWWGEALPDLRWSLLAAFVTLVSLWRHERLPNRAGWLQNNALMLFLAFVIWLWLQSFWAMDMEAHLGAAILFSKYLLLVYLIYAVVQTEEILRNVLLVHVLGCLFLGWLILSAPDVDGRFAGVGGPGITDTNALGMQLATGLLAASALILRGPSWVRVLALASVPLIVNGLVQTLSRGAVVGLVAGGVVVVLATPGQFRRVYYGLGILGLFILVSVAPTQFWERLGTIAAPIEKTEEVDTSTLTRLALAKAQFQMSMAYPFGAGHRGTEVLSTQYLGAEYMSRSVTGELGARSSHNTLLSVLVEQGVPGLILYACLLISVFRQLRRLKSLDAQGLPETLGTYRAALLGSLTCVLAAGLFTDYLIAEVFVWCLALAAALLDLAPRALPAPNLEPETPARQAPTPRRVRRLPPATAAQRRP